VSSTICIIICKMRTRYYIGTKCVFFIHIIMNRHFTFFRRRPDMRRKSIKLLYYIASSYTCPHAYDNRKSCPHATEYKFHKNNGPREIGVHTKCILHLSSHSAHERYQTQILVYDNVFYFFTKCV